MRQDGEMNSTVVFLLWHSYNLDDKEEPKLLGVYSTRERVMERRESAALLPGFRDHPGGFIIDEYRVDQNAWTEGFITIRDE
jgi:hypothetical protein